MHDYWENHQNQNDSNEVAQLCPTLCDPWTVAYQAPLSMGFPRHEYWSELPFPSPGDLPNAGIEPRSPALQADALSSEPPGKPYSTILEMKNTLEGIKDRLGNTEECISDLKDRIMEITQSEQQKEKKL